MTVTAKLMLFDDADYGDIGTADDAGYYDVAFTFSGVVETANGQAVCSFTMMVNSVLISRLFRLSIPCGTGSVTADEAESSLDTYLSELHSTATAAT